MFQALFDSQEFKELEKALDELVYSFAKSFFDFVTNILEENYED